MSNPSVIRQDNNEPTDAMAASETPESLANDSTAKKVEQLRNRAINATQNRIRTFRDNAQSMSRALVVSTPADASDEQDEPVLMLGAEGSIPLQRPLAQTMLSYAGYGFTAMWLTISVIYMLAYLTAIHGATDPMQIGAFMAGALAPIALIWIVINHMQRGADIQRYAEALRSELQSIIFPSEDRAVRVSRDIERLCAQAAELATASRTVLKTIGAARHGLQGEVKDFVTLSKKAEFHIDRLAGGMNERGEKLLDLTSQIAERTATIDARTADGVRAWEQATETVLERAKMMESSLGHGAAQIVTATAQTGEQIKELDTLAKNLDASSGLIATRTENLSNVVAVQTDKLSDVVNAQTEKLSGMMDMQTAKMETTATHTLDVMQQTSDKLQQHRAALDGSADKLVEQSGKIAATISESVQTLESTTTTLGTQTDDLKSRISSQVDILRDAAKDLGRQVVTVEAVGADAAQKLGHAMDTARSGAETVEAAVAKACELMDGSVAAAKAQSGTLVEVALAQVKHLNDAGATNIAQIREVATQLDSARAKIELATQASDAHVVKLVATVEDQAEKINLASVTLGERIDLVKDALAQPLRELTTATAAADASHEQIEETLRRRVADLTEATDKARENAETIRAALRGQAQEMSALSGQIAGNARGIGEQLNQQTDKLAQEVKVSLKSIEQVRETLEMQSTRLATVTDQAIGDIGRMENQISNRSHEVESASGKSIQHLRQLSDALADNTNILNAQSNNATEALKTVVGALDQAAGHFEPLFNKAMNDAQDMQARYEDLNIGFTVTAESNLEKLQKVGIFFDDRLQNLRSGSDQAAYILRGSGDHLQTQVDEIERAAGAARDKMREIERSLESQSSDIMLVTDQAQLKIDGVRKAVNEQLHELSESVGQSLSQIESVSQSLRGSAEQVDRVSSHTAERFVHVGTKALEQSQALTAAAGMTGEVADRLTAQTRQHLSTLSQSSQQALNTVSAASENFAARSSDLSAHVDAALILSQKYGQELKEQAALVAGVSSTSVSDIGTAVSALNTKLEAIREKAAHVTGQIDQSRAGLEQESERLLQVSETVTRSTDEAAGAFGRQSSALFKAVQDAAHHVEAMRREEARVQRETFLSASKFIVESLHSLSVDITRGLEGEVGEKTWKAFQKGDVAAFTRRLASLNDNMAIEKVRDKFAADADFRNYVQRFMRQFEEIFSQAVASDHSDLLSTIFVSSDVGRLYQLLCTAAGREPRTKREERRVA